MDKATEPAKPDRQAGRARRGKVRPRVSIEDHVLAAVAPEGSRFKGYKTYLVQDLVLSVRAIRYRRERWVTPDGQTIVAPLPPLVFPLLRRRNLDQLRPRAPRGISALICAGSC